MAEDLKEIKAKVEKMLEAIGEQLVDIEIMKDLQGAVEFDASWANGVDARLAELEGVKNRIEKKFNI